MGKVGKISCTVGLKRNFKKVDQYENKKFSHIFHCCHTSWYEHVKSRLCTAQVYDWYRFTQALNTFETIFL